MATVVLAPATQQQEQQETSAPATEQQPETINVNYFQRFDSGDYDIINYAILDDTSRYHYTDNNSLPLQYLEAKCFYAYNCTNTENMRVVIDSSGTDEVLADMCRLVNAPISNNPTREECINAFISAAMEHKAMKAARESQASASAPATTEQQAQQVQNNEPTLRDTLSKMTVKEIQAIARLVGVKNIFKWSKSSLISRTSCMIHCAFDDIKATALKMTRENFMKIINITDTEYLSLVLEELGYRSDLSREDCIKTFEEIFDDTNREAGRFDVLPHEEQEIPEQKSEQEKERRQYEEFMQLDAKVKATGTSSVLSTMEHFVYVSLLRQGFRQKHINDNEPTTLTSASTPAPVKINPEVKPGYDAAFDEAAYSPDVKNISVIVDDIPDDHEPDIQPLQTNKPDSQAAAPAKFIIGRHYQSRGLDKGTVTFLGKTDPQYGYFVDSINCYYRVKINTDSTGEYASISHKCGSFPADRISATHEVSEHEIISVANGTSILLDAENVIHSYQELEAKLAPQPAHAEPEQQQKKHCPLAPLSYWDRHTKYHNEKCRKNRKIIDTLQTIEEITTIMLDFGMSNIFEQAIYDRVHLSGQYPRETDEETTARYAETYAQKIIARRQRKAKAEARKNAPKPAMRKPRHTKKIDEAKQILIPFDEPENMPATVQPSKPKTRRTRTPRVKKDYSKQILIDFGENIPDGQNNQRIAA